VLSRLPRGRFWLAAVALALVLLSLVPPAATYARRYALTWLKDSENLDEELRAIVEAERPQPMPGRWPRPPRGWNAHWA
jgi:hypothetical protein